MLRFFLIVLLFNAVFAGKIDKTLQKYISGNPSQNLKVWIFFKDKGPENELSFVKEQVRLSPQALERRAKMSGSVISFNDYPIYDPYISEISDHLIKIRKKSRWLNALSALIDPAAINTLAGFDFISEIRLMAIYKKGIKDDDRGLYKTVATPEDSQFYGNSLRQLEQIGVIDMHKMGYTGQGITIAMLDDGFNQYDQHIVFNSLKIQDTYDFVNNDMDVTDRDSIPRQGWHGTQTLSVIGGYTEGKLIGTAYDASFLLAKTEIDKYEIQQEEDNWVAGLEWAEAHGADIVNSSLGYYDWYTWEDMDGQTAVTTLAANIAETKGVVVVVSAGNEGAKTAPNTLGAPADGIFVVTVGGVSPAGNYWSTSSYGPTADGRIKPDICAMGTSVYRASDSNSDLFLYGSGTSFSSPLAAGAIALLLQAYPDLTPQNIRDAIKKTASQATTPDSFLGYGILDIYAAYQYIKNDSLPVETPVRQVVNVPNPFSSSTRIEYALKVPGIVSLTVYDVSGREVLYIPEKLVSGNDFEIIRGRQLGANGIYFYTVNGRELGSAKRISKRGKLLYFK
jgi:serine protease AprX